MHGIIVLRSFLRKTISVPTAILALKICPIAFGAIESSIINRIFFNGGS